MSGQPTTIAGDAAYAMHSATPNCVVELHQHEDGVGQGAHLHKLRPSNQLPPRDLAGAPSGP